MGVVFHYDGPGAPNNVLTTIDQSGFFKLFTLGIGNFEISADGKVIVGSDGNVRSVPEGEIVWRFAD